MRAALLALLSLTLGALPAGAAQKAARPAQGATKVVAAPIAVVIKPGLSPVLGMAAVKTATEQGPTTATSQDVLARLPASAIASDQLAEEIAAAADVDDAMGRLTRLGLLSTDQIPAGQGDKLYLLSRLWDGTSSKLLGERLPVDRSWAVPAITVKTSETTYLVHPVNHGEVFAVGRKNVLKLVEQIKQKGHALASEQNAWAHFGFSFGRDLNDSNAAAGLAPAQPVEYGPVAVEKSQAKTAQRLVLLSLYTAGTVLAVYAFNDLWGGAAAAAAGLLGAGALWLMVTGRRALNVLHDLSQAREAAEAGRTDKAAQFQREAWALHGKQPDPLDVLRLSLPPSLSEPYDDVAARNQAMAQAARVEAQASGAKVVHLLVGYAHAAALAWYLAAPKDPEEGSHVA